jgi:hypothetical protein
MRSGFRHLDVGRHAEASPVKLDRCFRNGAIAPFAPISSRTMPVATLL